jgi:hypothetical protein
MSAYDTPFVLHVGYPKTGTTTFQVNVFPHHPEIDYIGKFIPSHQFRGDTLSLGLDVLLQHPTWRMPDLAPLKQEVQKIRLNSEKKVILLSSEAFIHPIATDIATVSYRLRDVFHPCKIWITIREQTSLLMSFYWMHGRYGNFITINTIPENMNVSFPISFEKWITIQKFSYEKSLISLLRYDSIIQHYRAVFGKDNVHVMLYEDLKENPMTFCDHMSAFLGVNGETTRSLAAGKHENASRGRSTPWKPGDRVESTKSRWLKALARVTSRTDASGNDEKMLANLRDDYRPSNRWLVNELGLPLARHNYPV